MAESGTDFAEPATLVQTNATSVSMTVGELNNKMLAAGFPSNVENDIDVRVKAVINDDVEDMYSDPMSIMITPYYVDVSYPQIYVPGSYQSASGYTNDWSPADAPPLFSANSDDVYEGYVYMANGSNLFKFTPAERNWYDIVERDGARVGTLEPAVQQHGH
ncbi:MAG: SusE domain-containing protein [Gracilimonas sp.]|nr:SusE domain-containing protein [Gracilimonas sp.]